MAAQLSIIGNSINYKLEDARRLMDEFSRTMNEDSKPRRAQVTPEMMQHMGIPIEIEYVKSA